MSEEKKVDKIEIFNKKLSKVIEAINATEIGKIEIDGKKYTTVATRTEYFRREFGFEAQIITDLINVDEESVIAKAEIGFFKDDKWFCIATGHAEEKRNCSKLNEVSALEIAETSAIGRALSNLGLSGGEYASANEVINAKEDINNNIQKELKENSEVKTEEKKITNAQKEIIKTLIKETNTKAMTFFKKHQVKNIDSFSESKAFEAIQELKAKKMEKDKNIEDNSEEEMKIL